MFHKQPLSSHLLFDGFKLSVTVDKYAVVTGSNDE